jgi:hypothetical protein
MVKADGTAGGIIRQGHATQPSWRP